MARDTKAADRSKYLWRIIYFDPSDSRLFIKDGACHWSINFAHSQVFNTIGLMISFIVGVFLLIKFQNLNYFLGNKTFLIWYLLSSVSAILLFYLNGVGIWLSKSYAKFILLGAFSFILGVGMQGVVNGLPVLIIGINHIQWYHHLYLGPMAALCQTFGKYLMILTALKIISDDRKSKGLELALLIGLGFTLAEITAIALNTIFLRGAVEGLWVGVWERASASVFHIYSAGLVALFILTKRKIFLLIVLILHASIDLMGGVYLSRQRLPYKLIEIEFFATFVAILTWYLFYKNYAKAN